MGEWRGPQKCDKCGSVYPNAISNLNKGKCQLYCGGTLVPWNRRAADSRVAALVKAGRALLVVMDRGDYPRKLDEALTWRQNDEMARRMMEEALAAMKEDADG